MSEIVRECPVSAKCFDARRCGAHASRLRLLTLHEQAERLVDAAFERLALAVRDRLALGFHHVHDEFRERREQQLQSRFDRQGRLGGLGGLRRFSRTAFGHGFR